MLPESWISRNWHPIAALVYLFICTMDFAIMPLISTFYHQPLLSFSKEIYTLSPDVQKIIFEHIFIPWNPVTIQGAYIFHIAFAGILGVTSWNRSNVKIEEIKQNAATQRMNQEITNNQVTAIIRDQDKVNKDDK